MQPFLDICQSDFTPPGFVLFCSVMCIHKCVHSLVICINLHSFQIHTCSKQIKFASERTRNIALFNGKYLFYICFRVFVESIFPFIVTLSVTVVLRSILKYCVCVVLKYVLSISRRMLLWFDFRHCRVTHIICVCFCAISE